MILDVPSLVRTNPAPFTKSRDGTSFQGLDHCSVGELEGRDQGAEGQVWKDVPWRYCSCWYFDDLDPYLQVAHDRQLQQEKLISEDLVGCDTDYPRIASACCTSAILISISRLIQGTLCLKPKELQDQLTRAKKSLEVGNAGWFLGPTKTHDIMAGSLDQQY